MKQQKLFEGARGFTILELLIFAAVFTVVITMFMTVLVSVTRVQVRQDAAGEVNTQSQFLLQTIQRYVERSSAIDMPKDVATTTLTLHMPKDAQEPTYIYMSSSTLFVQETKNGVPQPLNSNKVLVTSAAFTRRSNPAGHDSVQVSFTVAFNANAAMQPFAQSFTTAVARVSAAEFDSDLKPAVSNTYKIGVSPQDWQSINNTIFFSGANVGVGQNVVSPQQTLEVNGGLRLNTTNPKPACDSSQRGTFWVVQSGAGTKDSVQVCVKNASTTYFWATIY